MRKRERMSSPGMTNGWMACWKKPIRSESDLENFTEKWNGNLIRWQLVRFNAKEGENEFSGYDKWLDGMLEKTNQIGVGFREFHGEVERESHPLAACPVQCERGRE